MLIALLAYYERFTSYTYEYTTLAKDALRSWLGPVPQNYILLSDGRVIPSATTEIPPSIQSTSYLFDVQNNHIVLLQNPSPEGRFRHLPILSFKIEHESVGVIDISDWIAEIRTNPAIGAIGAVGTLGAPSINYKQLLALWGFVNNRYVPLYGGVRISITDGDANESVVVLE